MLLMRNVLLISFLLVGLVTMSVYAQSPAPATQKPAAAPATQAPAPPAPATQKPAGTTPAPRRAPTTSARSGLAITVTSPQGATIGGVQVALMGPTERNGETNAGGQLNFPGLQAGT